MKYINFPDELSVTKMSVMSRIYSLSPGGIADKVKEQENHCILW